ncbi:MAG: hypothetical protein OQK04_00835, partial [Kangiellaceae bacterium]|nr:hypothetical protein [Kangiellaceae bacterium]
KTGIGSYSYGGSTCGRQAGPHAVTNAGGESYCYDANGNMISGGGRSSIQYNTVDKPTRITTSKSHFITYQYGFGGTRFKRTDTASNGTVKDTLYLGNVEFISTNGSLTKVLRHIEGMAIETYEVDSLSYKLEFLHRDHLGSVELITDINGNTVKKFSYDPWGQRRDETSYLTTNFSVVDDALAYAAEDFRRGYTGHEHIDEAGLIHMNGRVYDPRLGRFLSADPFVQTAENLQNFNRYSYVLNNPLNATDPSGYFWQAILVAVLKAYEVYETVAWLFEAYAYYQLANTAYSVVVAFKYGNGISALGQAVANHYVGKAMGQLKAVIVNEVGSWISSSGKDDISTFNLANSESNKEAKDGDSDENGFFTNGNDILNRNPDLHGKVTELLDGRVKVAKWGSESATLTETELKRVTKALETLDSSSGDKTATGIQFTGGKELLGRLSKEDPLMILINDSGVNASQENAIRVIAIDMNYDVYFNDYNNDKETVIMSLERKIAHEIGHATTGISDIGNFNVKRTDYVMSKINGTKRSVYSNACRWSWSCW